MIFIVIRILSPTPSLCQNTAGIIIYMNDYFFFSRDKENV